MTWFRVDDGIGDHPKFDALEDGLCPDAAESLWLRAGAWCAKHLTDGHVPTGRARRMARDVRAPDELVRVGLWVEVAGGYQFHQWTERQPTRGDVEEKREAERARKAKWRAAKSRKASSRSPTSVPAGQTSDETRDSALTRPDPTRPDPDPPLKRPPAAEPRVAAKLAFRSAIESVGGEYQGDDFAVHDEVGRTAGQWAAKRDRELGDVLDDWAGRWIKLAEVRSPGSWLKFVQATAAGTPWAGGSRKPKRSSDRLAPETGEGFDEGGFEARGELAYG